MRCKGHVTRIEGLESIPGVVLSYLASQRDS